MQEEGNTRTNRKKPPLWNSCRLTFTICVFIGFFLHLCMRLNLSFTMRCMVTRTPRHFEIGANLTLPKEDIACALGNIRARSIPLHTEFKWSKSDEGILISAFFYGYIIGQPIGGVLSQVCRTKILFILSLMCQAVCNLLSPLMARISLYAIVAVRIIQGLLAGFVIPSVYQMYTVWAHPTERATLMSLAYTGFPVGLVLVYPLSSMLCQITLDNGWPMVFYVIGGVSFTYGVALFWLIHDTIDKHPRITSEEYEYLKEARAVLVKKPQILVKEIFKSIPIWAFCIVHFCQSWGSTLVALSTPQIMEEVLYVNIFWGPNATIPVEDIRCVYGNIRAKSILLPTEFVWSKFDEGLLISAFFYGYIIGQPIGGILCEVCGAKILFITGLMAQAACCLLLPLMARLSFYAIFFIRIVQGIFGGLVMPSAYQMYAVWAHPSERATLMALAYSGFPVGSVSIYPLSSALCQVNVDNGWPMVFYVIGGTTFIFCISLFWLIYDGIDKHPRITPEEYEYLKEAREKPRLQLLKIIRSIPIITFCTVHFCQSWGFALLSLSIPQVMEELLYVNIQWNGIYSAAPFVGSLTTRILLSLTYHRIFVKTRLTLTVYRKIFHVFGTLIGASILVTICCLTCHHGEIIVVLFGFLGGVQDLAFIGSYWTSYLELAPAFAGILSGFTNTLSTLTGIISPNVISSVVKQGTKKEWNEIFFIMIGLYVLSAFVYAIFGSSEPLPWGQFLPAED